jgi:hypothetical protein
LLFKTVDNSISRKHCKPMLGPGSNISLLKEAES